MVLRRLPALTSSLTRISETIYMKTQHVVADDDVQHPAQTPEGAYILDKDKTDSSFPLMAGRTADIALVSPFPSPSAENITNDNDCKLTTLVRIYDLQGLTM